MYFTSKGDVVKYAKATQHHKLGTTRIYRIISSAAIVKFSRSNNLVIQN